MLSLLDISLAVGRAALPVAGTDNQCSNKGNKKDDSKLFHTVVFISFTKINFSSQKQSSCQKYIANLVNILTNMPNK